jgi:hypothetical protein
MAGLLSLFLFGDPRPHCSVDINYLLGLAILGGVVLVAMASPDRASAMF